MKVTRVSWAEGLRGELVAVQGGAARGGLGDFRGMGGRFPPYSLWGVVEEAFPWVSGAAIPQLLPGGRPLPRGQR